MKRPYSIAITDINQFGLGRVVQCLKDARGGWKAKKPSIYAVFQALEIPSFEL